MAFKAVCLMVVAFVLVTAKASYMNEDFKEKAVFSKSVVPASTPAPPEVKSPTPAPPVVTPSTPLYKPPTPAPPVKTPPPAPPVNPPTPVKPPTTPAPPVYKPPSPAPPVNPPTPVKPPTGPMPPPVRTRSDCTPLCGQRCKLHSRKRLCVRACMTCCDRCKCVPPGTYGNREKCGKCYTDMTTRRNKPKCP
uniref:Gibberellin-regulated family protein n=1 Tax=Populus trichocarpa TaxID=3694 RepID=A0A2K2C8M5_POPTR|eukprot:XP_024443156.1 gibberellin-regulated protein 14 isoform X2 [Populus trichocarpa]